MSGPLSEIINEWNEIMPMQIRDTDIKNPIEVGFRRLLLHLLRELYVDTVSYDNMDNESGARLRLSRVRLVATVSHFYRISCPGTKQDFVFTDLTTPSFKKTCNIIKYLLNYVVFVRHTYKRTVYAVKEQLEERNDLLTTKNKLRKDIEEARIREDNNVKSMKSMDSKIIRKKTKISQLEAKEKSLKNEAAKIQDETERVDMKLTECRSEVENVKSLIVNDQEVASIMASKANVEKQLEEQAHITAAGRHKFKENSHAIEKAAAITSKMENLFSNLSVDTEKIKIKMKQVEELSSELVTTENDTKSLDFEITACAQTLEAKQHSIKELTNEVKCTEASKKSEVTKRKKVFKETRNILRKLSVKEAELASKSQNLSEKQKLLYQLASNAIKHMSANIYEQEN